MKPSIFLAISIDNFPSISCQATRFGWSMSALPCPQMFCIFHFSTMQMRFPVQHNAELCSHAAFDMAYDLIHSRFHIEGSLYIQHLVTSGGTLNCEETF